MEMYAYNDDFAFLKQELLLILWLVYILLWVICNLVDSSNLAHYSKIDIKQKPKKFADTYNNISSIIEQNTEDYTDVQKNSSKNPDIDNLINNFSSLTLQESASAEKNALFKQFEMLSIN